MASEPAGTPRVAIVYDGECPYCRKYTELLRLREAVGSVSLINARNEDDPYVTEATELGLDLDEGFAAKIDGHWYHGAECLQVLSIMSDGNGWLNRLSASVFRHRVLARALYPVMRLVRNATLFVRGKERIRRPGP